MNYTIPNKIEMKKISRRDELPDKLFLFAIGCGFGVILTHLWTWIQRGGV